MSKANSWIGVSKRCITASMFVCCRCAEQGIGQAAPLTCSRIVVIVAGPLAPSSGEDFMLASKDTADK